MSQLSTAVRDGSRTQTDTEGDHMTEERIWKVINLLARRMDLMMEIQREQINEIRLLIQRLEERNRLWRELTKEKKKTRRRKKKQPPKHYIS